MQHNETCTTFLGGSSLCVQALTDMSNLLYNACRTACRQGGGHAVADIVFVQEGTQGRGGKKRPTIEDDGSQLDKKRQRSSHSARERKQMVAQLLDAAVQLSCDNKLSPGPDVASLPVLVQY